MRPQPALHRLRPQPDPKLLAQAWANYDNCISMRNSTRPRLGKAWARVLLGLGVNPRKLAQADKNLEPMTAKEAKAPVNMWLGLRPFASELERFERETDLYLQKLKDYCDQSQVP